MAKSPAYQRYPKDYLSDENVLVMTLEEEGAYNRLMDVCWLEGSLPSEPRKLAALCKNISEKKFSRMWRAIAPCFEHHPTEPNRIVHPRLEKERQIQAEHKVAQSEAGKRGAKKRWESYGDPNGDPNGGATVSPLAKDSSASASASASASSEEKPVDIITGADVASLAIEKNPLRHNGFWSRIGRYRAVATFRVADSATCGCIAFGVFCGERAAWVSVYEVACLPGCCSWTPQTECFGVCFVAAPATGGRVG